MKIVLKHRVIASALLCCVHMVSAMEPTPVSDLAIAMRYDEICSAFDRSSSHKATLLLERVQKMNIDMSRLSSNDMNAVNYGRGLVDGLHEGFSANGGYKSACGEVRRRLIDKL